MTRGKWSRSTARMAEALYAIVCLFLWLGLPFPPGAEWFASVYLASTAIGAGVLAWTLRRPTALVWYCAAALSGLVLVWQLVRLPQLIALVRGDLRTPALLYATDGVVLYDAPLTAVLILTLGTAPVILQAVVAVCCYRLRHLRLISPPSTIGAAT